MSILIIAALILGGLVLSFVVECRAHKAEDHAFQGYSQQLSIKRGDSVVMPDGQLGTVFESTPDTLLVETEAGEMYSVIRWMCCKSEELQTFKK